MKDTRCVIDRFEGELAICEKADRTLVNISRSRLPPEAKEGDVIVWEGENVRIDPTETARRKKAAGERLKKLTKPS